MCVFGGGGVLILFNRVPTTNRTLCSTPYAKRASVSQFIDLNTTHMVSNTPQSADLTHISLVSLLIVLSWMFLQDMHLTVHTRRPFILLLWRCDNTLVWCAIRYYRCPLPVTNRRMGERVIVDELAEPNRKTCTNWHNNVCRPYTLISINTKRQGTGQFISELPRPEVTANWM